MYQALVCRITEIKKHPNADRLQIAIVAGGFEVIVGLDNKVGDLGIYFDADGQLSHDFLASNNLYPIKDSTGKRIGGGFFGVDRRVRAQKFRGVKSNGFFVTPEYFKYIEDRTGTKIEFQEGQTFDSIFNISICNKYCTRRPVTTPKLQTPSSIKKNYQLHPCFKKHIDYKFLKAEISKIPLGALIIITIKEHGTSAVTGYVPTEHQTTYPILSKFKASFLKVFNKEAKWIRNNDVLVTIGRGIKNGVNKAFRGEIEWNDYCNSLKPKRYEFMVGTRNVVLQPGDKDGFYGDVFRWIAAENFRNKLHKGETIYYEICGYTTKGNPLMGTHSLTTLKKEYKGTDKFLDPMTYTYGCNPGEHKISVYRITHTNEDGIAHDISWDMVKVRCQELGVETVREVHREIFDGDGRRLMEICNKYKSEDELKPSLIDSRHIDEGVVVRVEDGSYTPKFYKDKAFVFYVLEGIWKDDPNNVDIEEGDVISEEIVEEKAN